MKIDTKQYIKELARINGNVVVLGEYVNRATQVLHNCKICNHTWMVQPMSLIRGRGCPKCGLKSLAFTQEQYVYKLAQANSNIIVLGDYVNSYTKIECKCKKCGYVWLGRPISLLKTKVGCPKCYREFVGMKNRKIHGLYCEELKLKNSSVVVVGKYKTAREKILHKCNICAHIWMVCPNSLLRGRGCPNRCKH